MGSVTAVSAERFGLSRLCQVAYEVAAPNACVRATTSAKCHGKSRTTVVRQRQTRVGTLPGPKLQVRRVDFVRRAIRLIIAGQPSEEGRHQPLVLVLFRAQLQEQRLHVRVGHLDERLVIEFVGLAQLPLA